MLDPQDIIDAIEKLKNENEDIRAALETAKELISAFIDLPKLIAEYEHDKLCMKPVSDSSWALSQCRKKIEKLQNDWNAIKVIL